jgi:hypothetical protein
MTILLSELTGSPACPRLRTHDLSQSALSINEELGRLSREPKRILRAQSASFGARLGYQFCTSIPCA